MYKCNICDKQFKYKSDFSRHKSRKTPCKKICISHENYECVECHKTYSSKSSLNRHRRHSCRSQLNTPKKSIQNNPFLVKLPENTIQNNPIQSGVHYERRGGEKNNDKSSRCSYCNKTFSYKHNLLRHIKSRCKTKNQLDNEKEMIFQKLLNDMNRIKDDYDSMKTRIDELEHENARLVNVTTNNISNSNNTVNSNNTINIQLVAFGKEDKDSLTDNEIYKILKRGFSSVPELVKALHFDETRPENHNIYISNMRDNYVMVYDGDKWALRDRAETIDNIFDDGRNFLIVRFENMKNSLDERSRKFLKKFERFDYDIDHCPEKKDQIMNDIKLILYNKKDIPLKTRKSFLE